MLRFGQINLKQTKEINNEKGFSFNSKFIKKQVKYF